MSAAKILSLAEGLIEILIARGPGLDKDGTLEKRHEALRAEAMEFPNAEVLRRLEKAFQLLREGQFDKAKERLREAKILAERLAAKIHQGPS